MWTNSKLMKEIKDLNKWRDILFGIGRLTIAKMSIVSNLICRFNIILIKILATCFVDTNKTILIFLWKDISIYWSRDAQ